MPERWGPSPINLDPLFVGRAGVVIEVAPNQFMQFILEIRHGDDSAGGCDISLNRNYETVHVAEHLSPMRAYEWTIADIRLRGRVISQEEAERPSWAQTAQGEIGARGELEAGP